MNLMNKEENLDRLIILFPEISVTLLFLDLENDSVLEITLLHIKFQQDHNQDLPLHRENLLKKYNIIPLKTMINILKIVQSRETSLKLICLPLN